MKQTIVKSKYTPSLLFVALVGMAAFTASNSNALAQDPLPSWNEGATKKSITEFVAKVTRPGSPDFVPPAERIATFDNDGTLYAEQPMYFQLIFALDRVKALAPQHPEWKDKEPFASVLKGDLKGAFAGGEKSAVEIVMATHAGMTTVEFEKIVKDWLTAARHPRFKQPYTELVYQPMVELLAYLRANGFKTIIVSAGGTEFMRPWTEMAYGIPPEQVFGSTIKTKYRCAMASQCSFACPRSTSSTTRPASRWASTNTSAASPSPRSAIRTATSRCWNTRKVAPARDW